MKKAAAICFALVCLCLFSNISSASALLRMNLKAGDKIYYDMKMTFNSTVVLKGNLMGFEKMVKPTKIESTGLVLFEVADVDGNGVAQINISVPKMESLKDGKPMEEEPAPAGMGLPSFDMTSTLKNGLNLSLDNRSQVIDLQLPNSGEGGDMTSGIDVQGLLKSILNPALAMPEKEVEVGDSWNSDIPIEVSLLSKPITVSIFGSLDDYKEEGGKKTAVISTDASFSESDVAILLDKLPAGKLPIDPKTVKATIDKIDAKLKFERTLDADKGTLTGLNLDGTITLAAKGSFGGMNAEVGGDIGVVLQLTETSAPAETAEPAPAETPATEPPPAEQ